MKDRKWINSDIPGTSFDIDDCMLDDAILLLTNYRNTLGDKYKNITIVERGIDTTGFLLRGTRLENDQEYNKRIKLENRNKMNKQKYIENKKIREFKEYQRLKKKYGP